MDLEGWVIVYVYAYATWPSMIPHLRDEALARSMADSMLKEGRAKEILIVCSANELRERLKETK